MSHIFVSLPSQMSMNVMLDPIIVAVLRWSVSIQRVAMSATVPLDTQEMGLSAKV